MLHTKMTTLKNYPKFLLLFPALAKLTFASDYRCTDEGGVCQNDSNSCSGYYLSGLCDGSSSRKCCVPDPDYYCTKEGGTCQNSQQYSCENGSYAAGYCSGDAYNKCCIPTPDPDQKCLDLNGTCQDSSSQDCFPYGGEGHY